MAKQQPNPDAGKRQPDEPERPVESFEEDLADSVHEKAKSRDKTIARSPKLSSIWKATRQRAVRGSQPRRRDLATLSVPQC